MIAEKLRKRYRNKIIRYCVLGVLFLTITSIVVIAYLGSRIGNYTIQLRQDGRQISLASSYDFKDPTTRLRAETLSDTAPISVQELPGDDILDAYTNSGNHHGDALNQVNSEGYDVGSHGNYMAYTFFMKNMGDVDLNYSVAINLEGLESSMQSNGEIHTLDEVIRIRLYQNLMSFDESGNVITSHESKTYAKASSESFSADDNREWVGREDDGFGKAIAFSYSSAALIYMEDQSILANEMVRFTVVIWLEGDDPDCNGEIPVGSSIQLGMNIDTYEKTN